MGIQAPSTPPIPKTGVGARTLSTAHRPLRPLCLGPFLRDSRSGDSRTPRSIRRLQNLSQWGFLVQPADVKDSLQLGFLVQSVDFRGSRCEDSSFIPQT